MSRQLKWKFKTNLRVVKSDRGREYRIRFHRNREWTYESQQIQYKKKKKGGVKEISDKNFVFYKIILYSVSDKKKDEFWGYRNVKIIKKLLKNGRDKDYHSTIFRIE